MRTTSDPVHDLMKPEQLAEEWQVSVKTLANQRSRREGPPFVKIGGNGARGGLVRYSRKAVEAWLAAQQNDARSA